MVSILAEVNLVTLCHAILKGYIIFFLNHECELQLRTNLCLPDLGNIKVTAHDFAITVETSIREPQAHAWLHLGTSGQKQRSHLDLSAHSSHFVVVNCVYESCPSSR